jgi:hypothetical protein
VRFHKRIKAVVQSVFYENILLFKNITINLQIMQENTFFARKYKSGKAIFCIGGDLFCVKYCPGYWESTSSEQLKRKLFSWGMYWG